MKWPGSCIYKNKTLTYSPLEWKLPNITTCIHIFKYILLILRKRKTVEKIIRPRTPLALVCIYFLSIMLKLLNMFYSLYKIICLVDWYVSESDFGAKDHRFESRVWQGFLSGFIVCCRCYFSTKTLMCHKIWQFCILFNVQTFCFVCDQVGVYSCVVLLPFEVTPVVMGLKGRLKESLINATSLKLTLGSLGSSSIDMRELHSVWWRVNKY